MVDTPTEFPEGTHDEPVIETVTSQANRKSFRIDPAPASSLVVIKWEGGGEVPQVLSGMYTTPKQAKAAIAEWVAKNRNEPVEIKVKRDEDEKKARERATGYVRKEPQHI